MPKGSSIVHTITSPVIEPFLSLNPSWARKKAAEEKMTLPGGLKFFIFPLMLIILLDVVLPIFTALTSAEETPLSNTIARSGESAYISLVLPVTLNLLVFEVIKFVAYIVLFGIANLAAFMILKAGGKGKFGSQFYQTSRVAAIFAIIFVVSLQFVSISLPAVLAIFLIGLLLAVYCTYIILVILAELYSIEKSGVVLPSLFFLVQFLISLYPLVLMVIILLTPCVGRC